MKYFGIPVALTWFMSQKTFKAHLQGGPARRKRPCRRRHPRALCGERRKVRRQGGGKEGLKGKRARPLSHLRCQLSQGESPWQNWELYRTAKGTHFEERLPPAGTDSPRPGRNVTVGDKEGNGCRISGKRGNLSSVCETERARTLTEENYSSSACSVCSNRIGGGSASSRCCSARFCASCKSWAACTLARNSSKYIAL